MRGVVIDEIMCGPRIRIQRLETIKHHLAVKHQERIDAPARLIVGCRLLACQRSAARQAHHVVRCALEINVKDKFTPNRDVQATSVGITTNGNRSSSRHSRLALKVVGHGDKARYGNIAVERNRRCARDIDRATRRRNGTTFPVRGGIPVVVSTCTSPDIRNNDRSVRPHSRSSIKKSRIVAVVTSFGLFHPIDNEAMRDSCASVTSAKATCRRVHLYLAGPVHHKVKRNGKTSRGLIQFQR